MSQKSVRDVETTANNMLMMQRFVEALKARQTSAVASPRRHVLRLSDRASWQTTVVQLAYMHTGAAEECDLIVLDADALPHLSLHADEPFDTTKWTVIVRFFGRLSRHYPSTNATHAMMVDQSLAELQDLVEQGEWTADDLDALEESVGDFGWIQQFGSPTLADVCWYAAVRHVLMHASAETIAWLMQQFATRPPLSRWWTAARAHFENGDRDAAEDDPAGLASAEPPDAPDAAQEN